MLPSSSEFLPAEERTCTKNNSMASLRLNEASFIASLMPKKEIGADRFIESHPTYDGRGVIIAIFGNPRRRRNGTGSGDVDTSKVVKVDADGYIAGASGARLLINPSWRNPSQEWHIGCKLVYELFTEELMSRIKKERKKRWHEKNQEAISNAIEHLNDFDKKNPIIEDLELQRIREDLQNKLDFLKSQEKVYDDKGPIIDIVVWNDGEHWRVAIDSQSFEDGSQLGKLADFCPLTNYRTERKYGIFSKLDACSFVTNIYDEGNIVSIVTDCSPHGTHVAGIAAAFHPEEPLLNGVAPGAQLISCKIGDTRIDSKATGTGLTRALIAAVQHKCDLINMSYGGPTLLPDYGRFINLVNEVVGKHRLLFIASAGNNGPALSTVGAPGGTSSNIIGVGAYVSPEMAVGAHSVVYPLPEGMEYTWSSRGPTADGDLGVCISAPGGAVAPVPTWTLQSRMLKGGTSMASPSACGGVALIVSAMKAEGIVISPYTIRKALENTAMPISDVPIEKLTMGQGVMQVDRAYEYIRQSKSVPSVCYKVFIRPSGKSSPISRGIYLRGGCACQEVSETLKLHGGGLFRVPITIVKPISPVGQPPLVSFLDVAFLPGHIERRFIDVPVGATWAEAMIRTSNFDTTRKFFIDAVQVCPLKRPIRWETVVTFQSPSLECFMLPVEGGLTMELTIAQVWFSGIGSQESTHVYFEIVFHGINISRDIVVFDGSEASIRLEAKTLLASEDLVPSATLTKIKTPYRPMDSNLTMLSSCRDRLPSGKRIVALTLIYKLKLDEGAEVKPCVPLLNERIYDTIHESQFYSILDSNKRIYAVGDAYPMYVKLPKGVYSIQLHIRHENVHLLEKMKHLILFIERKLETKEYVGLSFFSQPDGHFKNNGTFKSTVIVPGQSEAFYVAPPSSDKLPECSSPGAMLLGSASYGTISLGSKRNNQNKPKSPVSYQILYFIPPLKVYEKKGKYMPIGINTVAESMEKMVRDTKLRFLSSMNRGNKKERQAWKELCDSLKKQYPKCTPLLASILHGLLSGYVEEDKTTHYKEIVSVANEVIESVDQEELAEFFLFKPDHEVEEAEKIKKMELTRYHLTWALYQKGLALAELFEANNETGEDATALKSPETQDSFEQNFKELKKWVDVKSPRYCLMLVAREIRFKRLGTALKVLCYLISNDSEPPKRNLYDLKIKLINKIGWPHLVSYERQWIHVRFPPCRFMF
ncbi:hypothetical protein HPP92_011358 [Vanilla planifolia]|uniref:tripeptidyl-peptidase II n=1 Tax=Vanilla planifolia TaxID=51239 RepID=A0A835QVJ0_VANPL|nr:hypothetical protein HPP92_011358 [Vanilla planifolia]